ncbi:heme-degrading domain-containing protein [Salinispirillum sp. LH 10-3-1]|uniref:Heme-degrading domain-containing protein n=1 Tax=Salinispirillum sp. LH 10-3-1 TaxID=2952525 RepID=A0AB38YHA1_9GAMM
MNPDIVSLDTLLKQESDLQFTQFDHTTGWALGELLHQRALQKQVALVIEVFAFQQVIYRVATAGAQPEQHHWVERKRASVLRFGHSTYFLGQSHAARGKVFEEKDYIDARVYAGHGGGFPLRLRNMGVIGAVTVSGLPQEEDHQWVVDALTTLLG